MGSAVPGTPVPLITVVISAPSEAGLIASPCRAAPTPVRSMDFGLFVSALFALGLPLVLL